MRYRQSHGKISFLVLLSYKISNSLLSLELINQFSQGSQLNMTFPIRRSIWNYKYSILELSMVMSSPKIFLNFHRQHNIFFYLSIIMLATHYKYFKLTLSHSTMFSSFSLSADVSSISLRVRWALWYLINTSLFCTYFSTNNWNRKHTNLLLHLEPYHHLLLT